MTGMRFATVVMIFLTLALAMPVIGQDEIMKLNSDTLGDHQRPLVTFAHEQHGELIECRRCHHDYDDFGANLADEDAGGLCSDCHTAVVEENPIVLKRAFHSQCRGCHMDVRDSQSKAPPVSCAGCHKKNAE